MFFSAAVLVGGEGSLNPLSCFLQSSKVSGGVSVQGELACSAPGEDNVYTVPGTDKKGLIKFLPINIIDLRLFTLLF